MADAAIIGDAVDGNLMKRVDGCNGTLDSF
jgi:hypothetical protein